MCSSLLELLMSLSKLLFIRLYEAEVCVWWCVESNGMDGKREDWRFSWRSAEPKTGSPDNGE